MQTNPVSFQDAVARAREIAQKLAASGPTAHQNNSLKRPNNDEDTANKRPALDSPEQNTEVLSPVRRAQLIAQKIASQLTTIPTGDSSSSISNQLTTQENYPIPHKFVGLVIGKGGEQILRLQTETGCKIKISPARPDVGLNSANAPDRIANLSGTREAINLAKKKIDEIVNRGKVIGGESGGSNPYSYGGGGNQSINVMLPSAKCGLIIGKGGETIRRISEELGVKMVVIQELTDIDGIEHKPLKITGELDRVERAKEYVLGILNRSGPAGNTSGPNSHNNSTNDYGSRTDAAPANGPCHETAYVVPYDKAGAIIGRGGESVKEISRRSGALVEVDKNYVPHIANSGERLFKIRGTPEQMVLAQQLMYEKLLNSPGGSGDVLTPIQFQQKFNLPLLGNGPSDSWSGTTDPYGASASSSSDLYSQWASAYAQWMQMSSSYGDANDKSTGDASSSTSNPAGANAMDPAWLAYYQSMSSYNTMQSSMTGNTTSTASSSSDAPNTNLTTTASSSTTTTTSTTNSSNGQADYTQQWIEYYRSIGQNDLADQIARQAKESGGANSTTTTGVGAMPSAMMSSQEAWAAYAQQWANNQMSSSATNGQSSSTNSTTH